PVAPPTLFTSTSSWPNAATVCSTTAETPAAVVTSAATAMASTPSARTSARVASSASRPRALRQTRQPSRASSTALPRPNPRLEPLRVAREGVPGLLAMPQVAIPQHVDQRRPLADVRLPEAHHLDPMLPKEPQRVVLEALVQRRHLPGCRPVRSQLIHHRGIL